MGPGASGHLEWAVELDKRQRALLAAWSCRPENEARVDDLKAERWQLLHAAQEEGGGGGGGGGGSGGSSTLSASEPAGSTVQRAVSAAADVHEGKVGWGGVTFTWRGAKLTWSHDAPPIAQPSPAPASSTPPPRLALFTCRLTCSPPPPPPSRLSPHQTTCESHAERMYYDAFYARTANAEAVAAELLSRTRKRTKAFRDAYAAEEEAAEAAFEIELRAEPEPKTKRRVSFERHEAKAARGAAAAAEAEAEAEEGGGGEGERADEDAAFEHRAGAKAWAKANGEGGGVLASAHTHLSP